MRVGEPVFGLGYPLSEADLVLGTSFSSPAALSLTPSLSSRKQQQQPQPQLQTGSRYSSSAPRSPVPSLGSGSPPSAAAVTSLGVLPPLVRRVTRRSRQSAAATPGQRPFHPSHGGRGGGASPLSWFPGPLLTHRASLPPLTWHVDSRDVWWREECSVQSIGSVTRWESGFPPELRQTLPKRFSIDDVASAE